MNVVAKERNLRLSEAGLAALALFLLALGLESALAMSLKLPGHRALPGAMGLIALSSFVGSVSLTIAAAIVPILLAVVGASKASILFAWIAMAGLLAKAPKLQRDTHWSRFILLGAIFGLLRYGALFSGFHKTPEALRLTGHLLFGCAGGALALGAVRILHSKESEE